MNLLDVGIVMLAFSAAAGGRAVGLLVRAGGWGGSALGLFVAVRVMPDALGYVQSPEPAIKLVIALAILLAGVSLGGVLGAHLTSRISSALPVGSPLRTADRALGAVAGAAAVLVAVWLLLPAMAEVPGEVSHQARTSAIADFLASAAPRPPDAMQALRGLVGEADFPQVFDALRPAPDTGPPPADSGLPPDMVARAIGATVRVDGEACGRVSTGSGFAAASDLVVTNAHVVAGVDRPFVVRPDGRRRPAEVVLFDDNRDLALLRVRRLGQLPLPIGRADEGTAGAVFGHPGGQEDVRVAPAMITDRRTAVGRDIYNADVVRREVLFLAAELRPGDSGAALVGADGDVVGVVFAIAPDRPSTAYALAASELVAVLRAPRGAPVGTGPCLR